MSASQPPTDPLNDLIERYLLSGDEEAMDQVVAATRPKLLVVARRIGAPQDAEDAVQGAYMSLLRKRGAGLDAPVLPWLLTTVTRLAYRRKAVQQRQRDLARRLAHPHEQAPPANQPADEIAVAMERGEVVRAQVARLPQTYRDAVVLRHLEGLQTRDVATLLDVPETTVRTRLHRAARLLRSKVAPALTAMLLFLPWCAADAWRSLAGWAQPILSRPAVAYTVVSGLLVAAVGLSFGLVDLAGGSVAPPSSPGPVGFSAPPIPAPRPVPEEAPVAPPEPEPERPPAEVPAEPRPLPEALRQPAPPAPTETGDPTPPPPGASVPPPPVGPDTPEDERPRPGQVTVVSGHVARTPPPGGMILLEGGHVDIGTEPKTLDTLLAGYPEETRRLFAFEAPRHRYELAPYAIGRFEVTNAQYQLFLEDMRTSVRVEAGGLQTLDDLAASLVGLSQEEKDAPHQRVWRQLYEANKGAIWKAVGARTPDALVWRSDHTVDEEATARKLRTVPLPSGLLLHFSRVAPPYDWPGVRPRADRRDHPVRFVSYNDAERFAEWAGLRLPTEQEWEWAARGPEGRRFPWGETWEKNALRANWGCLLTDEAHEARTVPVDAVLSTKHDARSWCGAFHMVGNVTEWTASWFEPYPGNELRNSFMGRWIKVLRGGGAADMEMLTLRSACRNWVGGGAEAPPYPDARFAWSGFRLAASPIPGQDHVGPVLRRATRARRIKHGELAPEHFVGMVTRNWLSPDVPAEDHTYILGRTRAVLFVPVSSYLRTSGASDWKRPRPFRRTSGVLKRSADHPWILGVLHSDLPLSNVEVRAEAAPRKGRKSARGTAPETAPGELPGGTWLLCLWHERLALMTPGLEFLAFLPPRAETDHPSVEVRSHPSKQVGPPTQRLTTQAGEGLLDFQLPLGGKTRDPRWYVQVRLRLPFVEGGLASPYAWQSSHRER